MSREDVQPLTQIIAENITELRRAHGMTQAGLAEKLGYSDKSVSKWERAEGVPDIICLKNIADMFGVTVDYLLSSEHDKDAPEEITEIDVKPAAAKKKYVVNRLPIVLVSIAGVWLLAAVVYVIMMLARVRFALSFVAAAVVTALLLVIFNALWGKRKYTFWAVDLLVWSILFLVCYVCRAYNLWLLMVIGFPAAVVVWFACRIRTESTDAE